MNDESKSKQHLSLEKGKSSNGATSNFKTWSLGSSHLCIQE